jgi:hypothetical protein
VPVSGSPGELTPRRRGLLDLSDDHLFQARFIAALALRDQARVTADEAVHFAATCAASFAASALRPVGQAVRRYRRSAMPRPAAVPLRSNLVTGRSAQRSTTPPPDRRLQTPHLHPRLG